MAPKRYKITGSLTGRFELEVEADDESGAEDALAYYLSEVANFEVNIQEDHSDYTIQEIEEVKDEFD